MSGPPAAGDAPLPPEVLAQFPLPGPVVQIEPFYAGHIHDSYRLTCAVPGGTARFLLQHLNLRVFPRPELLNANIARVTAHLGAQLAREGAAEPHRRALRLVRTRSGADFYRDPAGACWRLYPFIERTVSHLAPRHAADAEQAGWAFGDFQARLTDLPPPRLHETIPDFHNTPLRLAALERAAARDACGRRAEVRAELDALLRRRALADGLVAFQRSGAMPERVVHNDAKISNLLLEEDTGAALCVVDLDTVMPGLALFDFGDLVRSAACSAGEDEADLGCVAIDVSVFAGLARGYLAGAGCFLLPVERANLVSAGKVIVYEQAVRFLTDYLAGDAYYRPRRPGQNLVRCRNQLALLESIEGRERELEAAAIP